MSFLDDKMIGETKLFDIISQVPRGSECFMICEFSLNAVGETAEIIKRLFIEFTTHRTKERKIDRSQGIGPSEYIERFTY